VGTAGVDCGSLDSRTVGGGLGTHRGAATVAIAASVVDNFNY